MTDDQLKKMLEDTWETFRPRIPMGERRIKLAIAAMRRSYATGYIDGRDEQYKIDRPISETASLSMPPVR